MALNTLAWVEFQRREYEFSQIPWPSSFFSLLIFSKPEHRAFFHIKASCRNRDLCSSVGWPPALLSPYSPNQSIEPSPISKLLAEIVISVRQLVAPLLFSPRNLQILMYRGSGCGHDLNCFYFLIGSFILCVHRVESRRRPLWNAIRAIGAADYSCGMTVMKAGSETGAELRLPEHNLHPSFLRSSRAHPSKRHFLLLNFPL
jgi:hypothetical protein